MLLSALVVASSLAVLPAPPHARKVPGGGVAGYYCACPADLNGSGAVDAADLSILLGAWGGFGVANLDGLGVVDAADLSILLGAWGTCAVAPENDHCNHAIDVAPGTIHFCTWNADTDGPAIPGAAGCNIGFDQIDHDIWYTFFAPSNGTLHLSACGPQMDTKIAVYGSTIPGFTACPSNGITAAVLLACSDDNGSCSYGSDLTINVTAGEHYVLRVGGWMGHQGDGDLVVDYTPAGVDCEHAIDIGEPMNLTVHGSNEYTAAGENPDNCVAIDSHSIWYQFQSPCHIPGANMIVTTCNPGTNFDTVLTIWRIGSHGECALTYIDCNDDSTVPGCALGGVNRKSRVSMETSPGWIYYVQVTGYLGATGDFDLTVQLESCP